jgi:hypothetical protein
VCKKDREIVSTLHGVPLQLNFSKGATAKIFGCTVADLSLSFECRFARASLQRLGQRYKGSVRRSYKALDAFLTMFAVGCCAPCECDICRIKKTKVFASDMDGKQASYTT